MQRFALLVLSAVGLLAAPVFGDLTWTVEQLTTTGSDLHKWALHVSDGRAAWAGAAYGQNEDVYYYNGSTVEQLTTTAASEIPTDMDGGAVVWTGLHNGIRQVNVYRDGVTTRLDTPGWEAHTPRISGVNIAWWGQDSSYHTDLFVHDGVTVTQVSNDTNGDSSCDISGSTVVWQRWDGSGYEVFRHEIGVGGILNLTDSSRWAFRPRVDGDTVAWVGEIRPNVSNDVFCYCSGIKQLTTLGYLDHYVQPEVSGDKVVWCSKAGGDYHLYLYDGALQTTTVLASNSTHRYEPKIDGDYVVWSESDGHDGEIFLYDGATIHQITDDDISNGGVQISGDMLAWVGTVDQFGNNHVFAAHLVPEPCTALSLLCSLAVVMLRQRRLGHGPRRSA